MFKTIVLITAVVLAGLPCLAQTTETAPPVQTAISRESPTRLSVQMTNQSTKGIAAYVLVFQYQNPDGKACAIRRIGIRGLSPAPAAFTPGEAWTERMNFPSGIPATYKTVIDYVLFEDSTAWGPDTAKDSLRIQGHIAGFLQARAMLRGLLADQGIQAVTAELAKP